MTKDAVIAAYDAEELGQVCQADKEDLLSGQWPGAKGTPERVGRLSRLFVDRGAKSVLAVAHCDAVGKKPSFARETTDKGEVLLKSPWLDDRLGVYTILHLLPALGIEVDVLLTDGEESGQSTAQGFVAPAGKSYDWIVEFDRAGVDTVLYSWFDDKEWFARVAALMSHHRAYPGKYIARGSYTDICSMSSLGVCGLNVGVAYYEHHTDKCFAVEAAYLAQIARWTKFYEVNKGVRAFSSYRQFTPAARTTSSAWYDDYYRRNLGDNYPAVTRYPGAHGHGTVFAGGVQQQSAAKAKGKTFTGGDKCQANGTVGMKRLMKLLHRTNSTALPASRQMVIVPPAAAKTIQPPAAPAATEPEKAPAAAQSAS